ncbi:Lrp/AsnC family transcriptional regulator [Actinobacteria bacterium YIM 96077]|uniref:Lrp/AsnC family transcriptional regulator n=1 Tax=Phytoactinopolyspora halophila TaxID=1981511 RepID=A0A329QXM4_9ACTN|nr:Lrp/AsnC family transcriptional regulator [Phytoactinopolyspora halophila]AYY14931.1 Lrp/AsnC family transcriptional regulator [Actinobacteria bacterium YIM 96077]RAW15388.1 Lrp/AsnC family transcriptional regulator [Phytoactinopolyspora halophila]
MTEYPDLDPVDWRILAILQDDASITNKALAERVGLPTSSCHERVRRLRRTGVITGVRAVVDPAAVGRGLQAIIAVQLRPHSRDLVDVFTSAVLALPETIALYNVSGPEDYFLHVAVANSTDLQRIIVDHLATRPEVGHCQTHLIFGRPLTAPVRARRQ